VDIFKGVLGNIAGGKVLDVATLEGGFVEILIENLKDYSEIVGIDLLEKAIDHANAKLGSENIHFSVMDAEDLEFEDESFDTVSISASLHHLSNIRKVLVEMKRVLRPGGNFIIAEMHRETQSEVELTSAYLHQWAAEIDRKLGLVHNSTMMRKEILDCIERIGLANIEVYDFTDEESDPLEETRRELMESAIDRYIKRAEETDSYQDFTRRGEELRERIREVGARGEPILVVVGRK
jgi:ubiquinone/menaquinone biosynthesis C-methylase UbiE